MSDIKTKRKLNNVYSVLLGIILLTAYAVGTVIAVSKYTISFFLPFFFAVGMLISIFLTPTIHELGHVIFGKSQGFRLEYAKFGFISFTRINKKLKFRFAKFWQTEETQMVPKTDDNIKKRLEKYVLGGNIFSIVYCLILIALSVVFGILGNINENITLLSLEYLFISLAIYALYILFLNLPTFEYSTGKTDMLVYKGLKNDNDDEVASLKVMQIYAKLFEGVSYSDIPGDYYNYPESLKKRVFDAVKKSKEDGTGLVYFPWNAYLMLEQFKYYRAVENNDFNNAAGIINDIAVLNGFVNLDEYFNVIYAEMSFLHALNGDTELTQKTKELGAEVLEENTVTAKRIICSHLVMDKKYDMAKRFVVDGMALLDNEEFSGHAKFEKKLLEYFDNFIKNVKSL